MNNGAFGENFPYSNSHDLNMDWIIKIAKDFLDQYTNIQETITTGLNDLDTKAETLQALLQEWYDTHSEDIANQLADALNDLNEWYNTHQTYLDEILVERLNQFGTRAEAKTEELLESIPDDYTSLYNLVQEINNTYDSMERIPIVLEWEQGSYNAQGNIPSDTRIRTGFISTDRFAVMPLYCDNGYLYELDRYDANYNLIESVPWADTPRNINLTNTKYLRFILCKRGNTAIVPSEGTHLQLYGCTPLYQFAQTVNDEYLHYMGYVTSANMATLLPDANNAKPNTYYIIRFTEDEENILPNLPFNHTVQGETDFLYLLTFGNTAYKYQILYTRQSDIYTRLGITQTSYWFGWTRNSGDRTSGRGETIHVGSTYEYTKLTDAIKYAFEHENTKVIVHPGTYDIIEEMGASYWQNFTDYSDLTHSRIGHGAHFIFSADARVTCNYTGNNNAVRNLYSPFNCLEGSEGSFTIEGLVLRVSGCRYAIHDDVGASLVEQTHKYINCDIANDIRCIGAGLGANMNVEMRDCVFRSTGADGNNPVSWHNSGGGTTGKSSIVMTGCYITGAGHNTAQFLAYGSSNKQSRVLVSNNRFTAPPVCQKYDMDQPYMNFEMFAFNNQID